MNLVGKWSLTTPLMGLSHTCSYYEIFRQSDDFFQTKRLPGNLFKKIITHDVILTYIIS